MFHQLSFSTISAIYKLSFSFLAAHTEFLIKQTEPNLLRLVGLASVYCRSADSEGGPGAWCGGRRLPHDGARLHGHGWPRDLPWLGRRGIQVYLCWCLQIVKSPSIRYFLSLSISRDSFRTDWQKKCQLAKTLSFLVLFSNCTVFYPKTISICRRLVKKPKPLPDIERLHPAELVGKFSRYK